MATSASNSNKLDANSEMLSVTRTCRLVIAVACFATLPLTAACAASGLPYRIEVANYGSNGVELEQFPAVSIASESPQKTRLDPAQKLQFRTFSGHTHSLPEKIEIKWRLAALNNCEEETNYKPSRPSKAELTYGRSPTFKYKRGCNWQLANKVYTKRIDVNALRNSEAYKKAGSSSGDSLHPYYMLITLVFRGDQLRVVTSVSEGGGMHTSDDPNYW